ncbi:MAG: hypothetical protein P8181_11970, partial [bacterium]
MRAAICVWGISLSLLLSSGAAFAHTHSEEQAHSEQSRGAARAVRVELSEYHIAMPDTLSAGPTKLVIVNVGQADHNIEFVGQGIEEKLTANLTPGKSDTLWIDLRPGEYLVYCPVDRHEAYGMKMNLTVVGESGSIPGGGAGHEATHENLGFVQKLVRWLGSFHPPAVNFPVALLIVAAFAEVLLIRTGNSSFGFAARFCLWIGAVVAPGAAVLGWFLALEHHRTTWLLTTHRWLGTATAVVALCALVAGERAYRSDNVRRRKLYLTLLFLAAAMVAITGFFGGA